MATWSRRKSDLEALMVDVLTKKRELSIQEVVDEITKTNPHVFNGQTPNNSLYSIIYRRERRRMETGLEPLFIKKIIRGAVVYSLNVKTRK